MISLIELLNQSDLHLLFRNLHVCTKSLFPKKQTNKKSLTSFIRCRFFDCVIVYFKRAAGFSVI